MKTMLSRNGMCAAIEQVLTLPIRGAPYTIDPVKGDKGEAEFVRSVLMTSDESGGMKTPISQLVGQITTAQVFRRSFFERTFKVRESDGRIIYDKIAYRPPATCQARYNDRTGEPNGFRQQVWLFGGNLMLSSKQKVPGYVDIPKIRSYIYTHGKHVEPLVGVSEMEVSYWALAHGSQVQTPDGPVVIEDIRRGDLVFGGNGEPTRVTAVHPRGKRPMFRVTLRDGTSALCDAEHLWGVYDMQPRPARYRVVTTQEMMDSGLLRSYGSSAHRLWRYKIPRCQPVEYPERDLPIDPYILGAWLGDGSMQRSIYGDKARRTGPRIAAQAYGGWVAEEVARRLPQDMKLVPTGHDYLFVPVVARDTNPVRDALVSLGVNLTSGDKFLPEIYLQGSVKQRLDLLRGLMDTDGSATRPGRAHGIQVRFYTTSQRLVDDVRRLVRSLGGTATHGSTPSRKTMWVDIFTDECPFLLPPKAAIWEEGGGGRRQSNGNTIVSIEAEGSSMCRCITVEAEDGLFLVNDFMTTHNCYQLGKQCQNCSTFYDALDEFPRGNGYAKACRVRKRPAGSHGPRR
jgi:hypothetical protein